MTEQNDKLAKEFGEAAGKNDQSTVEQIQNDMETNAKKLQTILEENDKEFGIIMEKLSVCDVNLKVSIQVNEFSKGVEESAIQNGPIAGCLMYRSQEEWTKSNG